MKKFWVIISAVLVLLISATGCAYQPSDKKLQREETAQTTEGEKYSATYDIAEVSQLESASQNSVVDKTVVTPSENSVANKSNTSEATASVETGKVTADYAKSVALKAAGAKESEIRNFEIELDREKGILVYEISFKKGNTEYDYDIKASDGTVIKAEKEIDD